MFRRDKDSKIDNEGLRRMREAIRQRLDEEGTNGAETAESGGYPTAGMAAISSGVMPMTPIVSTARNFLPCSAMAAARSAAPKA